MPHLEGEETRRNWEIPTTISSNDRVWVRVRVRSQSRIRAMARTHARARIRARTRWPDQCGDRQVESQLGEEMDQSLLTRRRLDRPCSGR